MSFIAGYLLGLESAEQGQISPLVVKKNGSYKADRDIDGFSPVTVDVPIIEKTITENGTYYAADDGAEGFDPVKVNVKTYKDELDDVMRYVDDILDDQQMDNIGTITGTADFCIADVGTGHTYSYKAMYTEFVPGGAFGAGADAYSVTITIYRDGEFYRTINTSINARTEQSGRADGYGVDQLSKCFYWEVSEDSRYAILNYRFFSIGSWASYDTWHDIILSTQ